MKRQQFLFISVSFLLLTATLDWLAYQHFLYWRYRGFDTIVHLFGGLAVASFFAFVFNLGRRIETLSANRTHALLIGIIAPLLVGLLWELFEFRVDNWNGATLSLQSWDHLQQGWLDTLGDLLSGALGGFIFSTAYIWKFIWKRP